MGDQAGGTLAADHFLTEKRPMHALNRILSATLVTLALSVGAAEPRLPSVAVFPLVAQGLDNSTGGILTDALSDELLKSGKVRVMERSQMEMLLKEQGFQQSGGCDQNECAVQMGKILGIDRIVVGSAGKLGDSHTLSIRAVNVATGEVLASERRVTAGSIDKLLTDVLPPLAKSLANRMSGNVPSTPLAGKAAESPAVAESDHKTRIWPWVVGGTVVAGGAAAAVLLLTSKGSSSTPSGPATTNFEATW